ncbi:MAG TPA: hypothetical protein EYP19_04390 [Desulfobacterales bacterium]|nr:hypothetical protein [Desulfobacterales bacterium]
MTNIIRANKAAALLSCAVLLMSCEKLPPEQGTWYSISFLSPPNRGAAGCTPEVCDVRLTIDDRMNVKSISIDKRDSKPRIERSEGKIEDRHINDLFGETLEYEIHNSILTIRSLDGRVIIRFQKVD